MRLIPEPPSASRFARFTHLSKAAIVEIAIIALGITLLTIPSSSHFVRDLGIALLPVGLIALIYEVFLRESFIDEMRAELSESLRAHFQAFDRLVTAGLVDINETFPTSYVAKEFAQAKSIRILQTWIPDIITLLKPIKEAIKEGCEVKILLLDPNSLLATYRSKQLGYQDPQLAANNINTNLAEIRRICVDSTVTCKIEVRLYDVIPVACIHAYDDHIILGSFWHGIPAIQGPQFIIHNRKSFLSGVINDHFDHIWNTSVKYPLSGTATAVNAATNTVSSQTSVLQQ